MRVRLLGASTAVPHAVTPQGILLERPGVGTDVAVPFLQSSGFGVAYHDATVASSPFDFLPSAARRRIPTAFVAILRCFLTYKSLKIPHISLATRIER